MLKNYADLSGGIYARFALKIHGETFEGLSEKFYENNFNFGRYPWRLSKGFQVTNNGGKSRGWKAPIEEFLNKLLGCFVKKSLQEYL